MRVLCPSCRVPITVPDARAANPKLKVRCRCSATFALAEAPAAAEDPSLGLAPPELVTAKPRPRPGEVAPATVVPVRPPRPAVQARPAAPAVRGSRPAPPPPPAWAACGTHPALASTAVCPQCVVGYCADCAQAVGSAFVCPACDGLCVATAQYGAKVQVGDDRSRPLMEDLGTIFAYPLQDMFAFVLLALFTWFFGLMKFASFFAVILSQGVLVWYGFSALSKVAIGNMKTVMPEFTDIGDIARPMRLGFAALVIGYLPLFLCIYFLPGVPSVDFVDAGHGTAVVHAQEAAEDEVAREAAEEDAYEEREGGAAGYEEYQEPKAGPLTFLLLGLAFLWKLGYTPVALTVAGLSRSVLKTINPAIGVSTIAAMGMVYWQAALVYTAIALVQWGLGVGLDLLPVPVVPGLLKSFVDAYAWLAIGCTLGLAVYKKAPELGWD